MADHNAAAASASWASETRARFRDAVRTLRGKRPKHSAAARRLAAEQHAIQYAAAHPTHGIHTPDDVLRGALVGDEAAMFERLLASASEQQGPIVMFGAMLGETVTTACLAKAPQQQVIVVDNGDANPWALPSETFRPLVANALRFVTQSGQAVRAANSVRDFCRRYSGATPALVFINFVAKDEDARQIITWARNVGAHAIAGRGYSYASPATVKAVDDAGGPDCVVENMWRLRRKGAAASTTSQADQPLISIIVPAYNAREFIGEALADVSRQSHTNWELIVVEDGSAQDVEAEIREFAAAHPERRVVYHRKPTNTGVSSARNDAMEMCEGEFVAFLDADDRWLADHLQRKVRVLRDSGADLSYSRVEMYDSETGDAMCEWGPTNYELEHFPDSLFGRPYLQPSGVLVRRSLIEDVGHFDSKLAYAEDYDYWFRAVEAGKRFEFDEKVTSRYRKNHASAATTDRLVLCYQGVAEVGGRHVAKIEGDSNARRAIVARHFYAAAAGHMGFIPTERNRCRPEAAPALFEQAWNLGGHAKKNYRGYLWLARFAMKVRAPWLVRRYFEGKFRRINGS